MKPLLLFIIIITSFISNKITAQSISYYKDSSKSISIETVNALEFMPYTEIINDGTNYANYWIKVDGLTDKQYSIQIPNSRIVKTKAFQNNAIINQLTQQRFNTFLVYGPTTVFIKIDATKESYIPVTVDLVNNFQRNEKINFLIIGFYIGFVILIFVLNMLYAFNFRDRTYTYYALFLLSSALAFLISDGLFKFLHLPSKAIDILETINNIVVCVFAILFMNRFLQIHNYFPKFKLVPFSFLFLATIAAMLFIFTDNFLFYVALECLVPLALIPYWIGAIMLFNKNSFMKITVFAYCIILIFSIDFYITKLFGINLMHTTANELKIGSIIEMTILSVAVIYRMKTVHIKNKNMRNALVEYTKEFETLSAKIKKEEAETQTIESSNLSFREKEVMKLISQGKTNKEIANTLSISENTVKYHVKNIYTKLNIKSRKEVLIVIK